MAKYYRFVSEAEFQNLINEKVVSHNENKLLHILSEKPSAFIVPSSTNYDLTIDELPYSGFSRKLDLAKEQFVSYMAGTVSEDYLLELELDRKPSMSNLGWYALDDNSELCLVEYLIPEYTIEQVSAVYTGNFFSWKNVQHAPMSDYLTLETMFNAKGVEIIIVKQKTEEISVEQELMNDMMSLIASFSGKLYGMRSKGKRSKRKDIHND